MMMLQERIAAIRAAAKAIKREELAMGETPKADKIRKMYDDGFELLVRKMQQENPGMSRTKARLAAMNSAEFSELHRLEKRARLGEGF